MSSAQIRSIISVELLGLPSKFDPEFSTFKPVNSEIEKMIGMTAGEAFQTQARLDKAKKELTKNQFRVLTAVYFAKFITSKGFDVDSLESELADKREIFRRHLGKDWVYFLSTLVKIYREVESKKEQRPRGLLQVVT